MRVLAVDVVVAFPVPRTVGRSVSSVLPCHHPRWSHLRRLASYHLLSNWRRYRHPSWQRNGRNSARIRSQHGRHHRNTRSSSGNRRTLRSRGIQEVNSPVSSIPRTYDQRRGFVGSQRGSCSRRSSRQMVESDWRRRGPLLLPAPSWTRARPWPSKWLFPRKNAIGITSIGDDEDSL